MSMLASRGGHYQRSLVAAALSDVCRMPLQRAKSVIDGQLRRNPRYVESKIVDGTAELFLVQQSSATAA